MRFRLEKYMIFLNISCKQSHWVVIERKRVVGDAKDEGIQNRNNDLEQNRECKRLVVRLRFESLLLKVTGCSRSALSELPSIALRKSILSLLNSIEHSSSDLKL